MRATIAFLTLAIAAVSVSDAQWVRANVPYGGYVRSLAVSGSTLLAGTNVGLLRSTDNGESWAKGGLPNSDWTGNGITSLASNGSKCFVGIRNSADGHKGGGVMCSTDEGSSWSVAGSRLQDSNVAHLAVCPNRDGGTSVYAGVEVGPYQRVFRSTNDGAQWELFEPEVTDSSTWAALAMPDSQGGSIILVVRPGPPLKILVSTDDGASWAPADSGIPSAPYSMQLRSVAGIPDGRGGAIVFAGIDGYGVYRSIDRGKSWTDANAGLPVSDSSSTLSVMSLTAVYGTDGDTALLAGASGLYRSTDYGTSWSISSDVTDDFVMALVPTGNGTSKATVFAGTYGVGIVRSTDKGSTWTSSNRGLYGTNVTCTAVRGTTVFAGTEWIGVFRSTDYGTSWTAANTGMADVEVRSIVVSGSHLMAGTASGLFSSDNDAVSWTAQQVTARAIGARENLFLRSINGSGVFVSSDYGSTWTYAGMKDEFVTSFCFSDSCIFAAGQPYNFWANSRVHCSTDQGQTWTCANTFPFSGGIDKLAWCQNSDGSRKYLFAATSSGVFRSTDDGLTWAVANNGLSYTYLSAFSVGGGCLFVGIYGPGGVFVSTDYGDHWRTANAGLSTPYPYIHTFAVVTDSNGATTILAPVEGGEGMWRAPLKDLITSSPGMTAMIAKEFVLEQNYPNPFNPTTTIAYDIGGVVALSGALLSGVEGRDPTNARLAVYDLLGREVAVLVNERKAPGSYDVTFNGSNLASGVYLYRLQAGDVVQTKRLILLK